MNETDPILRDYFIEDIECNGVDTPVYVIHRTYRNLKTNVIFRDMDKLASFVEKIAQRTGRYVSYAQPLLNALAFFIPPEARVVSIEDTRELNIPRENWLPAVARTSMGIGKVGEVDLFALLKSSFRQTPDYLIVGEVRGKEAFVLFQGM